MSDELNVEEPFSQMEENAVSLHAVYESYVNAGFSEAQAFGLVQTWLVHALDSQSDD